jgi:hypothetical protein
VSVARIDRIYYSTQTPSGIPIGTFKQVTGERVTSEAEPNGPADPPPEARSR